MHFNTLPAHKLGDSDKHTHIQKYSFNILAAHKHGNTDKNTHAHTHSHCESMQQDKHTHTHTRSQLTNLATYNTQSHLLAQHPFCMISPCHHMQVTRSRATTTSGVLTCLSSSEAPPSFQTCSGPGHQGIWKAQTGDYLWTTLLHTNNYSISLSPWQVSEFCVSVCVCKCGIYPHQI